MQHIWRLFFGIATAMRPHESSWHIQCGGDGVLSLSLHIATRFESDVAMRNENNSQIAVLPQ
jgi:hypothetical protein